MGQTLSEPMVEKSGGTGEDERLVYGFSSMQGWRISMEDAHAAVLDMGKLIDNKPASAEDRLSFFGVYDGHGGDRVAIFSGENLHRIVAKQEMYGQGKFEQALKDGFLATDRAILNDPKFEDEVSGCTASVALLSHDKIYVANAGDSRTVLGVRGRAKPLSFDHKPQNEGEKARINAAGGFVDFGRVNGNLALSRALGDFEFKKSADLLPEHQIVTAYPDVVVHDISDDDEFLVIACDGIWDCQSSQAVVEFVRRGIVAKQELEKICENMMDNCLAPSSDAGGVGCDNMTMVVIALLRGRTKEQWYDEVAKRVAEGDGPCAPPEYAELRGPGVRNRDFDGDDDMDDDRGFPRGIGIGRSGQNIIFLSNSSNHLEEEEDDDEMDDEDEQNDLQSQVKVPPKDDERESAPDPEEKSKITELVDKTSEKVKEAVSDHVKSTS